MNITEFQILLLLCVDITLLLAELCRLTWTITVHREAPNFFSLGLCCAIAFCHSAMKKKIGKVGDDKGKCGEGIRF